MLGVLPIVTKIGLGSLVSKPITWAPIIILTGGATTGVVGIELSRGYPICNALKSVGIKVGEFLVSATSGRSGGVAQPFCITFSWLCQLPQNINSVFGTISSSVSSGAQSFIQFIHEMTQNQYSKAIHFVQGLQKTVFSENELLELIKDPHIKFPKLVKFFINPDNRKRFQDMFLGEALSKTEETFKILAGQTSGPKSIFKVQPGLLTHIVNKFLIDPDEAIKKVDRLSKLIGSVSKKSRTSEVQEQSPQVRSEAQLDVDRYLLSKEKIDSFFQKRSDGAQNVYEDIMLMEIGLHQLGVPIPSRGTSVVNSLMAGLLGSFFKK